MTSRAPTADLKHNSRLGIGECPVPALAGAGHETFEPQDIKMYTYRFFKKVLTDNRARRIRLIVGSVWLQTEQVIASPGLRLLDWLWRVFVCQCPV
jgi:hypothetical protein